MKSRKQNCFTAITLLVALAIPSGLAAQQQPPPKPQHYKLTVLGTLGGSFSIAQGINNKGQVAGSSNTKGDTFFDAFLWQHGVMKDLGHLPGGNQSVVFTNPNEKGDVSGYANTSQPDPNGEDFCLIGDHHVCLGFLWRDGVMKALPTLGGNNGQAFGVNSRGQVVGAAENTTQDLTCASFYLQAKPVIWQNGTVQDLPTIDGDADGWAYWMNDRGQAVGYSGLCLTEVPFSSTHAVLWPDGPNGGVIDLGNLGGTILNFAFYINNRGQVVGQSGLPGSANCTPTSPPQDCPFHAFLWQNGEMTDMGVLPGDIQSWANNINSKGQAVGTSFSATEARAFIWQDGVMTDLNTLIPPHSPLYLLEAFGINNRGQIAGWGASSKTAIPHIGFLLTPCNEKNSSDEDCGEDVVVTEAASANQAAPALSGAANPMMRFFGHRSMPWYRNRGVQPPPK